MEDSSAVYALNGYVWKLLEANLDWSKDDYNGQTPIIPSRQEPELMATGEPFIVYGSVLRPPEHNYEVKSESVAYNIYAPTAGSCDRISDLLFDTLKRQDDAATDVNIHLAIHEAAGGFDEKVFFTCILATSAERANPADEEGGFFSAVVMVNIDYMTTRDIQTTGFTYP